MTIRTEISTERDRLPDQLPDRPNDDIATGRRVLATEIAGLRALADVLDENFVACLDVIAAIKNSGRVVVTGMGKSGHVARKIAATLASTGTPAHYVHPGEASHGDMGMITPSDAVLALSNSGETPELNDLVAYAKRHSIPLIAMTARAGSALDKAADFSLIVPDSEEACPETLAPTTSTTVMIALGDAIAVALLERMGFSTADFQQRHPGGQLGRRFVKVSDIMHGGEELPLMPMNSAMSDTIIEMTARSFGCVGLTDDRGRIIGIITDGDLRRHMNDDLLSRPAGDLMTADPMTVGPDILAAEALGIMNSRSITSLFVVDGERPVGIIHIHDCLRAGIV